MERGHLKIDRTVPETNQQSIVSWHSRGGLAWEKMLAEHIKAFGDGVHADGYLTLETVGHVTWADR